jgi:hypothetical protein
MSRGQSTCPLHYRLRSFVIMKETLRSSASWYTRVHATYTTFYVCVCLCADSGHNKLAKTDHIDLGATQYVQDINIFFKISSFERKVCVFDTCWCAFKFAWITACVTFFLTRTCTQSKEIRQSKRNLDASVPRCTCHTITRETQSAVWQDAGCQLPGYASGSRNCVQLESASDTDSSNPSFY